jgi:transposase
MNKRTILSGDLEEMRRRLERASYRGDFRAEKRIRAVIAHLGNGESLSYVASTQQVSRRALCGWLLRYRLGGATALETHTPRGRKTRLTEEVIAGLKVEIHRGSIVREKHALEWFRKQCGQEVKRAIARYWYERCASLDLLNKKRPTRRRLGRGSK